MGYHSLLMQTKELKSKIADQEKEHITFFEEYSFVVHGLSEKIYIPCPTGIKMHSSDAFVQCMQGPYGSAKSTTCCAIVVEKAAAMPSCNDGIRRSRWAIVRNTYGDLTSTTIKTWLSWFDNLGALYRRQTPRLTYTHTFNDGNGIIVLELIFLALDRADDIRKLKSLELTGAYLEELCELPQEALVHFKGRVGRFPAVKDCKEKYWSGIIAATNPPETDHWMYRLFEIEKPDDHVLYCQPPGLIKTDTGYKVNPDAENLKNLPGGGDYYLRMAQGQTKEFINVYIMGLYGTVVSGKSVYTQYNDDLHAVDDIDVDENSEIYMAWDYGSVCPACLVMQLVDSRIHVIKEFIGSYITVKELYQHSVALWLNKYAKNLKIGWVVGDPAKTAGGNIQLEECGLIVEDAITNNVERRVSAVADDLSILIGGKPKVVISKKGCPKLRQGFLGKYNYKRLKIVGEEVYKDTPNKTHPHSDVHDCIAGGTKITMGDLSLKNIEKVRPGDYVLTHKGSRKVTHAWLARENATVFEYTFSDGKKLIATPDHKIFTNNGWIKIDELEYNDILYCIKERRWLKSQLKLFASNVRKRLRLQFGKLNNARGYIVLLFVRIVLGEKPGVLNMTENGSANLLMECLILRAEAKTEPLYFCTGMFGKNIMGKSPTESVSTIKTEMSLITILKTWNSWIYQNMLVCMPTKDLERNQGWRCEELLRHERQLKNGMRLQRGERGILNTLKKFGRQGKSKYLNVLNVEKNIWLIGLKEGSVLRHVNLKLGVIAAWMMLCGTVQFVARSLLSTNTKKPRLVETKLASKRLFQEGKDVYDLTVETDRCFFANGLLVHNCAQYGFLQFKLEALQNDDDYIDDSMLAYDEATRSKIGGY